MSRKVFTAGEVLAAADVNSFLMDQSIMSFAGTAARGSAIPSPVEGMVTYLEDIDDLRTYDGSKWTSPYAMTLISKTDYTAQTDITVNNVFSAEYQNYLIEITHTQSGSGNLNFTLVNGATPAASNWGFNGIAVGGNGTTGSSTSGAAGGASSVSPFSTIGGRNTLTIQLYNPFDAITTNAICSYLAGNSGFGTFNLHQVAATLVNSTSYEGFRLGGASKTGTMRIYGMRNA